MTLNEIRKDYTELHTSWTRGYLSRKENNHVIVPYKGKFGEGYAVYTPSWESTCYHHVTYFVK